jgi:hypothetical protein
MAALYCSLPKSGAIVHSSEESTSMSTTWIRQERRSPRLELSVPVLVYGHATDHAPFHDITKTLSVSTHGALVVLDAAVQRGQPVLLANCKTEAEEECRVVYVGPESDGKRAVGIAFRRSAVSFWGLTYNWKRKAWQAGEPIRVPGPNYAAADPRPSLGGAERSAPQAHRASAGSLHQRT